MKRFLLSALILVGLVLASGCSGPVSGSVAWQTDGLPVQNAAVRIGEATATTDGAGNFTFEKADYGEAVGSVEVAGFQAVKFSTSKGSSASIVIPDARFVIRLTENADEPQDIEQFTVSVGDELLAKDSSIIEHLPSGETTVTVEAPDHEPQTEQVLLVPGSNDIEIKLNLTALETYRRYSDALNFGRSKDAWKYLHPDVKERTSKAKFVKAVDIDHEEVESSNPKYEKPKKLKTWKPSWSKTKYKNVISIDRTVKWKVVASKYSNYGQTYVDRATQHWVQVDGRWRIIYNFDPKDAY